ncbi:hypothetical protein SDC9_137403 [bioreactor metagenome]|uniref:Uncharacterized protein n=1 Tax=bioreactor metagenome TaxID=1076179 RepID=A0A645DP21_9ZZZZ
MQQRQRTGQHIHQHLTGGLRLFTAGKQARLGKFDIPVAEHIPNKVVDLLYRDAQFKFFDVLADLTHGLIIAGEYPFVRGGKRFGQGVWHFVLAQIHMNKPRSVPNLVAEVTTGLDLFVRITHIVAGCIAGRQRQAQRIRTVFVNFLKGINTVTQRFAHLTALRVAHQTMNEHILKRHLAHLLDGGENHSGDPEEDDIIACNQHVGREEIVQRRCFFGPAQR